ncbi:unconventional myosin-IXa-like, partial [Antrostomus carolinensis]|uniref:unconventional myosin-IXa-like n=1 Tax=Antrostomus carolinensis TaxID=279965 RepID=UPI0010A98A19
MTRVIASHIGCRIQCDQSLPSESGPARAIPVSLVRENLLSVYKICLISIYIPSQLLRYQNQTVNFICYVFTQNYQKASSTHRSDSSKFERRNAGLDIIAVEVAGFCKAFGNAKTAHNNNSSRFGKFIQVNYQETGTVRGAYVEKYLLEKSRLVYQEHNERNYHVFYYLLAGASEEERSAFHLKQPEEYHYLNQDCFSVEGEDLKHDFERLQLAMEMVGFLPKTRRQIFSLLSAILHLGNIRYKKKTYRDDSIDICNPEILPIVSDLLE